MAKQFDNLNKGVKNMGGLSGLISGNRTQEKPDLPAGSIAPDKPKSIIWTNVPNNVHRTLKLKATDERISMAKLIEIAVTNYYGIEK